MKIIGTDNFNREDVADSLIAENIPNSELASVMCKALNDKYCKKDYAPRHYVVKEDSYRLSRGIEDLV